MGERGKLCSITCALALVVTYTGAADDLSGQASIIDADTLEIHGTRIRIWGIDAPESAQLCRSEESEPYLCGQKASNDLDAFIARRPVACIEVDRDQRYGRPVAICTVAGVDIADWLVRGGLAIDWPKFSKGDYAAAQGEARHAERGIWRGSFVKPWLYRACMRAGGRPAECSDNAGAHPLKKRRHG